MARRLPGRDRVHVNIFISWSGDRGQHFATTLREWLALILPDANAWMSTELRRGSNWSVELLDTLREARACLLCVTADGLDSTWEFFEAGMLHGSEDAPVLTRCVCLDVPRQVLAGGPLASIPAVEFRESGMLELLAEINALLPAPMAAAEIEARFEQARELVNARMTALPELRPRHITVAVQTPKGLFPLDLAVTGETTWATLVASVRDIVSEEVSVPVEARNLERCLDLDAGAWIVPPVVFAQLKATRIAFAPSTDAADSEMASAQSLAQTLRQILDVTPTQQRAFAAMRRDLRDLLLRQREFHDANARYASLGELEFRASPGTSIRSAYTELGFHAIARRPDAPGELAIRLGDGAGRFEEEPEGTEFMCDFEPTQIYVLKAGDDTQTDEGGVVAEPS